MSGSMTATTNQWMQFYQQPLMDVPAMAPPAEAFSDATAVTASPKMSSESILSPSNSNTSNPKGNNIPKPVRRRSRVSKRTPTTLLNANTTNFRALVQQFTGCPSTTMSIGVHKGPITLNFKQGSKQPIQPNTTRVMAPFGNKNYNQLIHQVAAAPQRQQEILPPQQLLPEQQSDYPFDYMKSSQFVSTSGNIRPNAEASDGLLMDSDFSLHELNMNAFSNGDYFM